MATQVLIAHTGQRLQIEPSLFASLDDFKASVANQSSIPVQCIIALTPQGKPLKLPTTDIEEIYIYDNRLTQTSSPATPSPIKTELPLPKRYSISAPPNMIDDTRSVASWQELFKARRAWALQVFEDCNNMAEAAHERYGEMDIMLRCLDAAVANLESVVKGLEPKYAEFKKWVPAAQADYGVLTTRWEQYLSLARSIPISAVMVQFMTGRDASGTKGRPQRQATLEDLIDLETARKAGRLAPSALRKFNARSADLDKVASRLFHDADELFSEFEKTVARSTLTHDGESAELLQDIEALVRKIDTDCLTTLGYSNSAQNVLQASKIAANHTERLLPSMRARASEMDEKLRYATQARNSLAAESVEFMRNITDLTALSHSVKSQISIVSQEDEFATFDYLRLIQQVSYMYTMFVVEAIQRREWFDKVRQDAVTLANEMALFQEEEAKRRRRWHKSVGDAYGANASAVEGRVPGLEVNLLGEDDQWPTMTRAELDDFFTLLQNQNPETELVTEIGKLIAAMSAPTKQQSKRIKAFKNGSVHEAALGRSGLLIRGDGDLLRSLQEDKLKLENKLKTSESRVRRLEDLLHRQTQASRPNLGNLFQTPSQQFSDRGDSTISLRSPRASDDRRTSLDGNDGMFQRIQQLEAELHAEKQRSANMEKELSAHLTHRDEMTGKMEEVNSTKKDLMENMEALKREFVEERKSLEDEIKRLQTRLEDTEDEIEHFGESRENEKASYNERVQALEQEIERLAEERRDEGLKSDGQVEFLRKEARLQRERIEAQERQLQTAQDESKNLSKRYDALAETAELQLKTLRGLWSQLLQGEEAPGDLTDLIEGVSGRVGDALATIRGHEGDVSLVRMDLESAQNTIKTLRAELATARERLSCEETISIRLREAVAEAKAKVLAVERELADGREQLSELRVKIADGETGSESLRKRLEEQELKLASITEELASRQSQVRNLEAEVRLFRDKADESQVKLGELTERLESRTDRAKDLTQRLYMQNERLARLLERLGFSVTRQGSSMVIQKVPRSERSTQNATDPDPSSSLRRSGTFVSRVATESTDLELLYWMNNTDADAEAIKYEAYMTSVGTFDIDAFSDAVYRRLRDLEHMARKLQRDARAYREKAHGLQKEAHDKIAFKHFKEGDLALFLPTRNQTTGAWAAFNVGFPHYFLREQETHRLGNREWLVARISRIQERVVDLSKSLHHQAGVTRDGGGAEVDSIHDEENDNPFDLSDGLRWYLIDAVEDKPGAPSTPGLAKSTVAANNVEAMAERGVKKLPGRGAISSGIEGVSKTLSKSLESRRSSTSSRKALPFAIGVVRGRDSPLASETNSLRAAAADTPTATSPTQHVHIHTHPQPAESQLRKDHASDVATAQHEVRNDMDSLMGP